MTAATMKVYYDWGGSDGAPGTAHNVTDNGTNKVRFKQADNATIDSNNPIPVPTSGSNYSYWKHMYLLVSAAEDMTQIDNVKFYSDGAVFDSYGGVDVFVATATPIKTSAIDAGYDLADSATALANHGSVSVATNANNYTSGSPLTVSISESGNILDGTNDTTDYVLINLKVGVTASSGTLTAESLVFQFDEV